MEKLWLAALALYLALGAFDPVCAEDAALSKILVPPKRGQCPHPSGLAACVELCSADSSCPKDQKCCKNGCGHVCMAPIIVVPPKPKPGQCPRLRPLVLAPCLALCSADIDCPKDQKCCKNGCGHGCMAPIIVVPPKPKPGQCPRLRPLVHGPCLDLCSADIDCPKDQKCCKNGCGHVCMAPIKDAPPKPGMCPCRESIPSIVCVRHPCICESCSVDGDCPNDEKCCSNACGHVCIAPLKLRPKPGRCPRGKRMPTMQLVCKKIYPCTCEYCTSDYNCPKDEKCCKNECGHVCVAPYKLKRVNRVRRRKRGRCPRGKHMPSMVKVCKRAPCTCEHCSSDFDCPKKEKCCKNECGHVCVAPYRRRKAKYGRCVSRKGNHSGHKLGRLCKQNRHCPKGQKCHRHGGSMSNWVRSG